MIVETPNGPRRVADPMSPTDRVLTILDAAGGAARTRQIFDAYGAQATTDGMRALRELERGGMLASARSETHPGQRVYRRTHGDERMVAIGAADTVDMLRKVGVWLLYGGTVVAMTAAAYALGYYRVLG